MTHDVLRGHALAGGLRRQCTLILVALLSALAAAILLIALQRAAGSAVGGLDDAGSAALLELPPRTHGT
ncbi:MAG TPA: hypothetical protein VK929_09870 [Longimicrobiales bacterium]|nr:hypothetical protein [Longimicrobiales bacterium]